MVSHVMIAATRKVKEKGEPELQEAVKRGALACKTPPRWPICRPSNKRLLPCRQNQGERRQRPPRRRRTLRAGGAAPRSERDRHAALRKAWDGAKALRVLWETADDRTKEWFVGAVLFETEEAREAGPKRQ